MEDKKEKIQKLLNLATSDNEHEAALALAKATELMNKWNLDKGSVLGTNIEKVERELPFYKWTSENQVLVNLLTRLCDGFVINIEEVCPINGFASGFKNIEDIHKIIEENTCQNGITILNEDLQWIIEKFPKMNSLGFKKLKDNNGR